MSFFNKILNHLLNKDNGGSLPMFYTYLIIIILLIFITIYKYAGFN